jgi:hypothetical protein
VDVTLADSSHNQELRENGSEKMFRQSLLHFDEKWQRFMFEQATSITGDSLSVPVYPDGFCMPDSFLTKNAYEPLSLCQDDCDSNLSTLTALDD